jgi:hypothetical protein
MRIQSGLNITFEHASRGLQPATGETGNSIAADDMQAGHVPTDPPPNLGIISYPGLTNLSENISLNQLSWPMIQQGRDGGIAREGGPEESMQHTRLRSSTTHKTEDDKDAPASSFELGDTFRPETYATSDTGPVLLLYGSQLEQSSDHVRVLRYEMLFYKTSRSARRVTISMTVSEDSPYWDVLYLPDSNTSYQTRPLIIIPLGLYRAIIRNLAGRTSISQDSRFSLFLGHDATFDAETQIHEVRLKLKGQRQHLEFLRQITNMLHHMNVRWYVEEDIIRQSRNPRHGWQVSFLESRFVMDFRFGSPLEQINSAVYELQVLAALRGCRGINQLAGLVLDPETKVLTGFLSELPATPSISVFIREANNTNEFIGWERRGKWCWQLIEAVSEVHSKGLAIGLICKDQVHGVGIDWWDNITLFRFRSSFTHSTAMTAETPPEHRMIASEGESLRSLPQTDIYQLGLMLWRLATHMKHGLLPEDLENPFQDAPLKAVANDDSSTNAIPLPQDIPNYMRDIIIDCLNSDPLQRPPAWKLLEKFPPQASEMSGHGTNYRPVSGRGESPEVHYPADNRLVLGTVQKLETRFMWCDLCSGVTSQHLFHCGSCAGGNFDICPQCVSQGKHCNDDGHYLQECFNDRPGGLLYSKAGVDGVRRTKML